VEEGDEMRILAFNGSPRKKGNTSAIIRAVLRGAKSGGAETVEVRLHDLEMKGCRGCLACRKKPGVCAQRDELSPYLEMMKTCQGIVVGCPIYMYRICGQMKLFVDRCYSLYVSREDGGYDSAIPPGKTYALVVSQGAPQPDQYQRSVRWLAGMTGSGFGMREVGRIVHADSNLSPAAKDKALLEEAFLIGRRLTEAGSE
jgi:multimeric flavodoxin WrbA